MIDKLTEERIKGAAKILDILEECGVEMRAGSRGNYVGRSPFRADEHEGSFVANVVKNIVSDFATGESWDPISFMLKSRYGNEDKKTAYPKVLRDIAAIYNIYVDDEPVPERQRPPKMPTAPTCMTKKDVIMWPPSIVKYYRSTEGNTLLEYLRGLPIADLYKKRLEESVVWYQIGTYPTGRQKGWTIWWQIDPVGNYIHDGKMMAYKSDGHRDKQANPYMRDGKQRYYSFDWASSMMARAGKYDTDKYEPQHILFGLHLVDMFQDAEICIVESEKSAVICSMFCDINKRVWMATAGKGMLSEKLLKPLMDRKRNIVLYPDKDGHDQWSEFASKLNYDRISVSKMLQNYWKPEDGEKADIADVQLRLATSHTETEYEKAKRMLEITGEHVPLKNMITTFDMKVE